MPPASPPSDPAAPRKRQLARPGLLILFAGLVPLAGAALLAGGVSGGWIHLDPSPPTAVLLVWAGALLCGLALLPTHAVSLYAGYVMGGVTGTAVAWLGIGAAAQVGFLISRRLGGPGVVAWLEHQPKLAAAHRSLTHESTGRTLLLVTLLRLSPAAPFGVTNVLLANAALPARIHFSGTFMGMLPRIAAVAFLGAELETLDFSKPAAPWLLALGIGATVAALGAIGVVTGRALAGTVKAPPPSA